MSLNVFLWFLVFLGFLEVCSTCYYSLKGEVPKRTPHGMAVNAFGMGVIAMWALLLAVKL